MYKLQLLLFRMDVYFDIKDEQLPIIYSPHYNIHFMGMEKLHPFDSAKWEKIYRMLESNFSFCLLLYIFYFIFLNHQSFINNHIFKITFCIAIYNSSRNKF